MALVRVPDHYGVAHLAADLAVVADRGNRNAIAKHRRVATYVARANEARESVHCGARANVDRSFGRIEYHLGLDRRALHDDLAASQPVAGDKYRMLPDDDRVIRWRNEA